MTFPSLSWWSVISKMMVTITVFCGAVDGIDDGISVWLHGRFLVVGWLV
ncbi:hypothetical protein [Corynebacterium diphtheriae]|nr:hypothetical protein [Corynebacterium diphtheriae]UEB75019.1 hypothetical protein LK463_07045 [Corynebacterium diphtheriae]